MARTFKGYASRYSANQTQPIRARRSQVRVLTVDYNGVLDSGQTVESVTWESTSPWVTYMQDAAVSADQKSVTVNVTLNYSGFGWLKATATMSDGSVQNYEFMVDVMDSPIYPSATYISPSGPYSLTASAP